MTLDVHAPSPSAKELSDALAAAASRGDHGAASRLLSQGADATAFGSRALTHAAMNGHAECVALLIPASNPMDEACEALEMAARFGHAPCVALLIPAFKSENDGGDALGDALFGAAVHGQAECVELLLPLSPLPPMGGDGSALAHVISRMGHPQLGGRIRALYEAQRISAETSFAPPSLRPRSL